MSINIGIDLGTTYSAVAMLDPESGLPTIVKNEYGDTTTPSVLCFLDDGDILFGQEAKDEYLAGNSNAAAFYKREMGKDFYVRTIGDRDYTATDLSSIFLKKLVASVENCLFQSVGGAVITVPAYFSHKEVSATIEAAKMAGIKVLSTIHEPTAAALAYGLNMVTAQKTVLFYDLGGGTFDVTIAKIAGDGIDVLGSDGDHQLGGKDWDDAIARYLINEFSEKYGIDLNRRPEEKNFLLSKAERVKKDLSTKSRVKISLFHDGSNLEILISADTFSEIAESLCEQTSDIIESLFDDLGLSWGDIDSIILVGGSTRMPMIRDYLSKLTSIKIESGVNVDEAVAIGAAIKANMFTTEESVSLQMHRAPLPQAIAIKNISDVVAHSLGMIAVNEEGTGYTNSQIIKKNSKIPVNRMIPHRFFVGRSSKELEIYVLQGESKQPLDNTIVNKYVATEIERTSRDGESIEVTYSYDEDGLIKVTASQDGRELPIRIDRVPQDMSWVTEPIDPDAVTVVAPTILMAIDVSGSMEGPPLIEAKKAMIGFIDEMVSLGSEIGVILFSDSTEVVSQPTDEYDELKNRVMGISIGGCGYGNSAHPFKKAGEILDAGFLIVLTDGQWGHPPAAISSAQKLHNKGVDVIALGFGSADEQFLKTIATMDDFASLTDLSELSSSFGKIAQVIGSGSGSIAMR
jgi:molecular chaperone DnaK (HSP70)/uncharacterized protein YegL